MLKYMCSKKKSSQRDQANNTKHMSQKYLIREIKFDSGERHSVLIHPDEPVSFFPSYL